jgi:cytochrome c-type biogenesis protein CcmE
MKPQGWKYIISLVVLIGLVWFGVTAFDRSLTPYVSFAEARHDGGYVQVNGKLADQAVTTDGNRGTVVFRLRDSKGEVMEVLYHGVKPANFEMATNIVALGTYHDGRFDSDKLLVKCPSKYQAEAAKSTS